MAHTIWKGTLGFGLVSRGVELLTADSLETLDLDLLDRRDNAHIGYQKINKTTGKVVPTSEIVRGFAGLPTPTSRPPIPRRPRRSRSSGSSPKPRFHKVAGTRKTKRRAA